jgi:hypothetical protein
VFSFIYNSTNLIKTVHLPVSDSCPQKRYSKLEIYVDVKVEKYIPVSEHKHFEFHAFIILVLYSTKESLSRCLSVPVLIKGRYWSLSKS